MDYFTEFWMRRKAESNDKIVFYIVEDLLEIYEGENPMAIDSSVINDTLLTLWDYNHRLLEADSTHVKQVTLENFEIMRSYGLDYSANNLITYSRFQLPEERDSLIRLMPHDSLEFHDHWGDFYYSQWVLDAPDYGP